MVVLIVDYINYIFMNDNSFKMCIDCANKQSSPQLSKGMYYCPFVQGILPNGIVHYDTDAAECIRKGIFRDVNEFGNKYPINHR